MTDAPTNWDFIVAARAEFQTLWQDARSLSPKQAIELREAMQDVMNGVPKCSVILPRDGNPVAIPAPYIRKALLLLRTVRMEEQREAEHDALLIIEPVHVPA